MKTILSIDGGGIRGIIPATVLAYFEQQLGKSAFSMFDLTVGTSTGGILSLALNVDNGKGGAKYGAQDIVKLYENNGKAIFCNSFWKRITSIGGNIGPIYASNGIEQTLEKYFGDKLLSSALSPVMITAYDIEKREPYFMKSWKDEDRAVKMKDAARATSAAPTYFEPAHIKGLKEMRTLIDGGVFINNPSVSAYAEAKRIFNNDEKYMIISLGTGELIRPIAYQSAKHWGRIGWAIPALSCVFDGVSDAAHYQLNQILGENYFRLQTVLNYASDDMDDASTNNIANLKYEAKQLIEANKEQIEKILNKLSKK
jgi:patatin-like phospholipase/acyl hydrolase